VNYHVRVHVVIRQDVHRPFLALRADVYFEPEGGRKQLVSSKTDVTGRTPMAFLKILEEIRSYGRL
jgi:hypothetical protein